MAKDAKQSPFRGRLYGRRVVFQLLYQEDINPGAQELFSEEFIYNELNKLCNVLQDDSPLVDDLDDETMPSVSNITDEESDNSENVEPSEIVPLSIKEMKELVSFVRRLFHKTLDNRDEIDRRLELVSAKWSVMRMAKTERNILRMAVADMLYMRTPKAVAIHEALELGNLFGTKKTTAFLNGILDRVDLTKE